jgi:hypothetical protein
MKTLSLFCITVLCLILCHGKLAAETKISDPVHNSGAPVASPAAVALLVRLDQINAMDKTRMSASAKKSLRKEVRSIKKELKTMNGGVYLSAGAIIVIILLFILLL